MTMRRLPNLWLALAALALLFAMVLPHAPAWMFAPARVALKVSSRVYNRVLTSVTSRACAQDVLEFKPIPAESAAALERRRAARRAQREAERARVEGTSAP